MMCVNDMINVINDLIDWFIDNNQKVYRHLYISYLKKKKLFTLMPNKGLKAYNFEIARLNINQIDFWYLCFVYLFLLI